MRSAHFAELFLEADQVFTGARIARWHRAARARITPFESDFADLEAHHIVFIRAKKLVFPKRGHAVNLERGAEAFTGFIQLDTRKKVADGLQGSSRHNRRPGRQAIIRYAFG